MTIVGDLVVDRIPRVEGTREHLASWYTQGLSDGLGDRLLMFDNTNAPAWELLRFRPTFAAAMGFEAALRERVASLAHFRHPLFTTVRSVEELGSGDGLALVATYAPGRRLSEAFARARTIDAVVPVIQQLTPALAALHQQGQGIAHGVLTAERIMVTTDGRLIIREHVLGSALERLGLSSGRLWADLGIVVSPTEKAIPPLDKRTDVIQLALIALSLMLGRRVSPAEYPRRIGDLLDRAGDTAALRSPQQFRVLRRWLERALQVNGAGFECAQEADLALSDLADADVRPDQNDRVALLDRPEARGTGTRVGWEPRQSTEWPRPAAEEPSASSPAAHSGNTEHAAATDPVEQFIAENETTPVPRFRFDRSSRLRWLTGAIAVVALAEAGLLARLYWQPKPPPAADAAVMVEFARPGADVIVDGRPAGVTPLQVKVDSHTRSIRVISNEATNTDGQMAEILPVADTPRPAARVSGDARTEDVRAPRPPRTGGVKVSAPFELTVLEGERLLGSNADGTLVTTPGRHELELVNSALGYRSKRIADVKAGQVLAITVPPQNGSVSINAQPWAEVWIDGNSVGETPIGNLSIPLGEHEIVFRHPQLGERREKAIVRSDRLTRISANLKR